MAFYRLSAFADEAASALGEQLRALRENGIDRIELRGIDGKNVSELTDSEARAIKRQLDGEGVLLSAMGSPYGKYPIGEPLGAHIDAFKRGLELCDMLGAARVRMFSFFIPEGADASAWRDKVFDGLDQMLTLAEGAGVRLAHENEKGIYGDDTARCLDLMRHFGDRMGLIFDPANFIQTGVRPMDAWAELGEYVEYMHIKDALADGGAVVPAGAGDGDVGAILKSLGDARDGEIILTVEPHLTVFDGLSGLQSEALKHKYTYSGKREAFDAAIAAIKGVLEGIGYQLSGGDNTWHR